MLRTRIVSLRPGTPGRNEEMAADHQVDLHALADAW